MLYLLWTSKCFYIISAFKYIVVWKTFHSPYYLQYIKAYRLLFNFYSAAYLEKNKGQQTVEQPVKPKIPDDLVCPLCNDLLTDALLVPCCANSYCDDCKCVNYVVIQFDFLRFKILVVNEINFLIP